MNPSTGPSHFGSCPEILRGSCPLDFPRDSQSPAHFKVPEAPSLDSVHPSPSFEHSLPEGKSADSGFQELDVFPEECGERDQTSYVCDGIVEDGQSADKRVTPSGESTDGALAESTSLVENCTEQDGSDDDVVSHNDVSVTPLGNSTTTIPSALGPSDQAVNIEWAFEVEEIPLVAGVNAGLVRSSTSRRGARSSSRSVRFSLNETADPSVAIRPHRTDSDASSRISVDNGEVLLPSSLNVVADRDTSEASSPSIDGPSTLLPSPRVPRTQPSDTDVSRPPPAAAAATAPPPPPPPVATTIQDDNSSVVHFPGDQGETEEGRKERVGGFWPHSPSALFASLACTVGPYNICRFSYLSYLYGGSFILQFLMLTVIFGLPLLSFQMSVGQFMGAGIMNMWKVSPVFYGVGISAIIAMAFQGIYNVIPISWMFVYFRDSFITNITFKWGECRNIYRLDECQRMPINTSDVLEKAVPAYFQNRVLQRQLYGGISTSNNNNTASSADLVFENVFNLAVIWMVTFICLSKGIKSYGKVVLAFGIFPMLSFYLLSIEILRRASSGAELIMSSHTDMSSFFLNGWSWLAAAREVFFIWGFNGAALMQIASHNKLRHDMKRDCAIVILITLSIILLSAFLACACIYAIYKYDGYQRIYVPSSFETMESSRFLVRRQVSNLKRVEDFVATNYMLGVELKEYREEVTTTMISISGYQPIRFATEIYPTALVAMGPDRISAFWPVLFYLCLITFGIAQQLAIWKCVIEGLIAVHPKKLRSWETSITFLACIFGFVLGLPFTTQIGVLVVHFMDVCVGSAWWIMIIYLVQVFALLLVRGRPYTSEDIVVVLTSSPLMKKWFSPVITFSWNIVLPIALLVVAITSFRLGDFGGIFSWEDNTIYTLWPAWAKQMGALIQILPILIIPVVCLIQVNRYLFKGQGDLLQRFENLIRPTLSPLSSQEANSSATPTLTPQEPEPPTTRDDPPPKYTPPPSYNTATGLKLLKRLNSLRRSLRRSQRNIVRSGNITTDAECQRSRTDRQQQTATATNNNTESTAPIPPSYANVMQTTSDSS